MTRAVLELTYLVPQLLSSSFSGWTSKFRVDLERKRDERTRTRIYTYCFSTKNGGYAPYVHVQLCDVSGKVSAFSSQRLGRTGV